MTGSSTVASRKSSILAKVPSCVSLFWNENDMYTVLMYIKWKMYNCNGIRIWLTIVTALPDLLMLNVHISGGPLILTCELEQPLSGTGWFSLSVESAAHENRRICWSMYSCWTPCTAEYATERILWNLLSKLISTIPINHVTNAYLVWMRILPLPRALQPVRTSAAGSSLRTRSETNSLDNYRSKYKTESLKEWAHPNCTLYDDQFTLMSPSLRPATMRPSE